MASLLQQLENNEAILLMYLAGELPPDDMAEVAQMLAADAGLRAELETLRAAHEGVVARLAQIDRSEKLPVPQSAAVARVGRAARQWHADRAARKPQAAPAAARRTTLWWVYPAAAAAILVGFLVWWGNHPGDGGGSPSRSQLAYQYPTPYAPEDVEDRLVVVDEGGAVVDVLPIDDLEAAEELADTLAVSFEQADEELEEPDAEAEEEHDVQFAMAVFGFEDEDVLDEEAGLDTGWETGWDEELQ